MNTEAHTSDRHTAERAGFRAEIQALERVREREMASGKRPSKVLDLDVGYHLELEAVNKRLEMDNRLMAPRVSGRRNACRPISALTCSWRIRRGKSTSSSLSCGTFVLTSSSRLALCPRTDPADHLLLVCLGRTSRASSCLRARSLAYTQQWAMPVPSIFCWPRGSCGRCAQGTTESAV